MAGDPRTEPWKKCFFFITHSPYFIDIRTTQDLRHCLVFRQHRVPAFVDTLDTNDERMVGRLIPRLNTHHKQFFFASRPIFVEGYFDQQLFTLIQEKRGLPLGASGTSIIDVSGKEELDLFFRLCKKLKLDAQFISDLDLIVRGKLRQSVSQDDRCKAYLQAEGLGENLMTPLGQMERQIDECLRGVKPAPGSTVPTSASLREFFGALGEVTADAEKRYQFLLAMRHIRPQIEALIPEKIGTLNFIEGRLAKLVGARQEHNHRTAVPSPVLLLIQRNSDRTLFLRFVSLCRKNVEADPA